MAKREILPYSFDSVCLRLLAEADLPMTLAWRNRDEIRRWFFYNKVITLEQHQDWFERYRDADDDFVFVIEDAQTGVPVGQVSLYHIEWAARCAEFGRLMIGEPNARGKGYAKAATNAVLKIAGSMGLKEIYLEVLGDNTRAFSLYKSVGFVETRYKDNIYSMRVSLTGGL